MSDTVASQGKDKLVPGGNRLEWADGWGWIANGWELFMASPGMWVASWLAFMVVAIIFNLVPVVGGFILQVLSPVVMGGFFVAARNLDIDPDEGMSFDNLLEGFRERLVPLLIVGFLYLLMGLVAGIVIVLFAWGTIMAFGATFATSNSLAGLSGPVIITLVVGVIVATVLITLAWAATWLAIPLVMLDDMAPVEAMKESFRASFVNLGPLTVYGLAMLVITILAIIPFGLGLLALFPLWVTSTFMAYRTIFKA